jgi:branched-chain amino acid transport system ATP-binding protein
MPLLRTLDLSAGYGLFQALFSVSMHIEAGEAVALIGSNGAGKSTLLKCIAGDMISSSTTIEFRGYSVGHVPAYERVGHGISLVPEGRRLFASLTVEENLLLGCVAKRAGPWDLRRVYTEFPVLEQNKNKMAQSLSGGQQQLVAIARALMGNPALLLCDEISLGLSPVASTQVHDAIKKVMKGGVSVLLVEQNIQKALNTAQRFYCMRKGALVLEGKSEGADLQEITRQYFGVNA